MLRTLQEDFVHEEPFHFNKRFTFDSCFFYFAGLLYKFNHLVIRFFFALLSSNVKLFFFSLPMTWICK